MGINRNHRFVTSEKCVEGEDNLSLHIYKYFPLFLFMQSLFVPRVSYLAGFHYFFFIAAIFQLGNKLLL